jgi:hypothetical protein
VNLAVQVSERRSVFGFLVGSLNDYRNLVSRGDVVTKPRLIANNFVDLKNIHDFANGFGDYKTTAH